VAEKKSVYTRPLMATLGGAGEAWGQAVKCQNGSNAAGHMSARHGARGHGRTEPRSRRFLWRLGFEEGVVEGANLGNARLQLKKRTPELASEL
jgi:hypothetical protein